MGSFFGLADFKNSTAQTIQSSLNRMMHVHGASLAQLQSSHADSQVGIGRLPARFATNSSKHHFFQKKGIIVFFDGTLLNRASIAATSQVSLDDSKNMSNPQLLYHAFVERDVMLFSEIDGIFRLAIWDSNRQKLFVAGDRFGFLPVYFYQLRQEIIWGSEVKFILSALSKKPTLNLQAVTDFLAFGCIFDGATLFQGIQQIPNGHFLAVDSESVHVLQYAIDEYQPVSLIDFEDAKKRLRNAALTNLKANSASQLNVIFDNGGIESRFLTAANRRLALPFHTIELQRQWGDEVATSEFTDHFLRTVWLMDGLLDGKSGALLNALPSLKNEGDAGFLAPLSPMHSQNRLTEILLWQNRKWNQNQKVWLAGRLFQKVYANSDLYSAYPQFGSVGQFENTISAIDRLKALVAAWDFESESPNHVLNSHFQQIPLQFIQAREFDLLNHFTSIVYPLFTASSVRIAQAMSDKLRTAEQVLLKSIIQDFDPQLSEKSWERNAHLQFLRESSRNLFSRKPQRSATNIRSREIYALSEILNRVQIAPFFEHKLIRESIELVQKYPTEYFEWLSRLATIAVWHQIFVEEKSIRNFYFKANVQYFSAEGLEVS